MKKRVYNSEGREAQAAKTRQRILESAKRLFLKEGFDRVTIGKLAEAAEVSSPTIYAIFQSKRGVLQELIDEALPQKKFQALVEACNKESSAEERLRISAKIARQIYDAERELMDLLRSASIVSPELKELEQERENRRHERQGETVKTLANKKVLKEGVTLAKARDILWAFTGRDIYRLFVIERSWPPEEYEKWLAEQLINALLKSV